MTNINFELWIKRHVAKQYLKSCDKNYIKPYAIVRSARRRKEPDKYIVIMKVLNELARDGFLRIPMEYRKKEMFNNRSYDFTELTPLLRLL